MSKIALIENSMPGFSVVEGRSKLVSVKNMAYHLCIDDRPVSGFRTKTLTHGVKTMGATYGTGYVDAVDKNHKIYDGHYFQEFADKVRQTGKAIPAVHDISHMHCKHAGVVASGGFGDNIKVMLNQPNDILTNLNSVRGKQVYLAGNHHPQSVLRLNFNEGTTLVQEGKGYTMDMWWAWGVMGISFNALCDNLSKTLRALSVSKIEVYG